MSLTDKTALVTGGSRGIGCAIALKLASCGANVAIVYAGNEAAANETLAAIEAKGVKGAAYRCDVASFEQTAALAKTVEEAFGGVDILVNNAGIVRDGILLSMAEADFDAVLDTNLKGSFNMIRHLYRQFMRRRSGRIINITSVVGLSGNAGQANYAAAKSGLVGLTRSVAKELAARSVTCNAVAPGFIDSEMTGALPEKVRAQVLDSVPMRRMGAPEEVAALVAFLAGDEAGYITGEVICIDGGMSM